LRLQTRGLLAPARTPEGVIGKLNAVVNARLRAANMQAALAKLGLDARMLSPQESAPCLRTKCAFGKRLCRRQA
jgi:tripartite-type tricarboxylate transporter receptor subunit TctC